MSTLRSEAAQTATHSLLRTSTAQQTAADKLLAALHPELEAIKSNPLELEALRSRVTTPRQPLTLALQAKVKAKDERIAQLEEALRAATSTANVIGASGKATGSSANSTDVVTLHVDKDEEYATSLDAMCERLLSKAHSELQAEQMDLTDHGSVPPATSTSPTAFSPVRDVFCLAPQRTGFLPDEGGFIVEAFREAREEREAGKPDQGSENVIGRSGGPGRAADVASEAHESMKDRLEGKLHRHGSESAREDADSSISARARSRGRPSVGTRAAEEASKRAVTAAKKAEAASSNAAEKAAIALAVEACDKSNLSAQEAWEVTKAPREAAAAAKALKAAQEAAEVAAFEARCANLHSLADHENAHNIPLQVSHDASKRPADALLSLATFVREERRAVQRHGEEIGEALALSRGVGRGVGRHGSSSARAPERPSLADRMSFSSDVKPTPLGFAPLSPFQRKMAAEGYHSPRTARFLRSRA